MKRRTEITVEEQIRIFRNSRATPHITCTACSSETWMISPEDAALAAGVSVRAIYRAIEEGRIHFLESAGGALVVCPRSVLEQARTA